MNSIKQIYKIMYEEYGPQGWWPLLEHKGENPTKTGMVKGYHPGDYTFPKTSHQVYQICIGAILTQNVGWVNVEKALVNLNELGGINPGMLIVMDDRLLKDAIRPAGYYNQKAKKLIEFTNFYLNIDGEVPSREKLMGIWGVGNETADSMLLYAFKKPEFVVDTYTKRIFSHLGFIKEKAKYCEVKALFKDNLETDLVMYQEYHALIVEHAKRYYSRKPYGVGCPLHRR